MHIAAMQPRAMHTIIPLIHKILSYLRTLTALNVRFWYCKVGKVLVVNTTALLLVPSFLQLDHAITNNNPPISYRAPLTATECACPEELLHDFSTLRLARPQLSYLV